VVTGLRSRWAHVVLTCIMIFVLSPSGIPQPLLDPLVKANRALGAGSHEAALEFIEEAISFDPALRDLHLQAAEIALVADNPEAAHSHFLAAPADALTKSDRDCLHAQILLGLGDAPSEPNVWQEAPQDCPGYEQYLRGLAENHRKEGHVEDLLIVLEEIVTIAPSDGTAHLSLAIFTAITDPENAISRLRQTNNLSPSENTLVADLIRTIENARLEDESSYTLAQIGQVLATHGKWDYAVWAFQKAIELYPDYVEARAYLGLALDHTGQDGLKELQEVVTQVPNAALPRIFLAMHWQKNGQFEKARLELSIAAHLDPTNPVIAVELGKAYTALGDVESAKDAYILATQLAPNDATFWMILANYSVQNDIEVRSLGLPAARNSVVLDPDNAVALDVLGYAHLLMGDLTLAERLLWRAEEIQPYRAWTHYHVGLLYSVQGDGERARSAWQFAAHLDPGGPAGELAQRALNRLFP
jgi:tetratricopeptide (TPR) repeat protein